MTTFNKHMHERTETYATNAEMLLDRVDTEDDVAVAAVYAQLATAAATEHVAEMLAKAHDSGLPIRSYE